MGTKARCLPNGLHFGAARLPIAFLGNCVNWEGRVVTHLCIFFPVLTCSPALAKRLPFNRSTKPSEDRKHAGEKCGHHDYNLEATQHICNLEISSKTSFQIASQLCAAWNAFAILHLPRRPLRVHIGARKFSRHRPILNNKRHPKA